MKKGFTLVELLAVISILGILALVTVLPINYAIRNSREQLYKNQLQTIEVAANDWGLEHIEVLPVLENDVAYVTLGQLKKSGLVENDIKNPIDGKLLFDDMLIEIRLENKNYYYKVLDKTGGNKEYDVNSVDPLVILKGDANITVDKNSEYIDQGVFAMTHDNKILTNIFVSVLRDETLLSSVDTSISGTYNILYTVRDNELTKSISRIVIVK